MSTMKYVWKNMYDKIIFKEKNYDDDQIKV